MPDVPDQLREWSKILAEAVDPVDIETIKSPRPTPTETFNNHRWLAVAASVLLVATGIFGVALLGNDDSDRISPSTNPSQRDAGTTSAPSLPSTTSIGDPDILPASPLTTPTTPDATSSATAPTTTSSPDRPDAGSMCADVDDPESATAEFAEAMAAPRRSGAFSVVSGCVAGIPGEFTEAPPACWTSCGGFEQTITSFDTSVGGTIFVPGLPAREQYYISLAVTYRAGDQRIDVGEGWTLVMADGALSVDQISFTEPVYTVTEAVETLNEYLGYIEREEWLAAAAMLDDGAINSEERSDLQRLGITDYSYESVASALETWCRAGCDTEPATVSELVWDSFLFSIQRSGERISVAWFEGDLSISGLPIRPDSDPDATD